MADSIWWTKMLHKEDFCEHFCEMSDKEIVDDIRKSIASFMKQREEGEDFGAKMVHKARLRIDAVHDVRSDAGKQGGRPRKDSVEDGARESQRRAGADSVRGTPLHSAPARPRAKNSRCPNSREEFHAFVADNNLHEGLAEEWYAMHEAREWVDKNGNPIKDWRGALYNYCTNTEQKRRTA